MIRKEPRYQNRDADRQADLIITGDWHLMENNPVCRTDDFAETTQWKKVDWVSNLQKQFNCPVLHTGDLFDFWKPSPELLSKATQHLPDQFFTVYGNHDLPQHNLELAKKCGIYNLAINGRLTIMEGCHWMQTPDTAMASVIKQRMVLGYHIMTYQGVEPWPGCTDPKAAKLLRQYPQFDLICTGDNHKPFTETYEGRWLVNPGSIFRMTADQINHKPRVYLWYADDNSINMKYLPIDDNVISRDHLDAKAERDGRIDAFIDKLDDNFETSLSFEENLEQFRQANQIRQSVMNIIYKSIEL